MAERITVELVKANRGEKVLVEADRDDIFSALAAFADALATYDKRIRKVFIRAVLDLERGSVTIEGDPALKLDGAAENFDVARVEYGSGPGWGGPGLRALIEAQVNG